MKEFNTDLATAFVTRALGTSETPDTSFDKPAFDKIVSKHSISKKERIGVRQALALGHAAYLREAQYHNLDVKSIRAQLSAASEAAVTLKAALANLSPDAVQILSDYRLGMVMAQFLPDLDTIVECDPTLLARSMFENGATEADFSFDTQASAEMTERLLQTTESALTFARANKSGPRPDARFSELLGMARVAWVSVLGRPFNLDWTDANVPITDAARFCFDVSRAVDPNVEPKKIRRAARVASEENQLNQLLAQFD